MRRLAPIALSSLLLAACDCAGEEPSGTTRGHAAPARTATLEGIVKLADGAELPRWPDNPLSVRGQPPIPESCTPPQLSDREPVRLSAGRGLSNVVVTLADFAEAPPHEPATHEVVIRDCRLTPSVVIAVRGDRLRLVNQTDHPFMPELGQGMLQALLHEQSRELTLEQLGTRPITCAFLAPCGRTDVVTVSHPLHALTDEDGRFRIEGVPANDELRVGAWHPLFVSVEQRLTLRPGETRRIELSLVPTAPTTTPEEPRDAPDAPSGHPEDNPDILF